MRFGTSPRGNNEYDLFLVARFRNAKVIRKGAVANQEVPRFAAGGFHSGGLRLVGEKGPELEITGPSRIYNSQRTKDLLSDGGNESLRSEIAQMRNDLYAGLVQIAKNTAKTAVVLNKFDYDGLPDSRGY